MLLGRLGAFWGRFSSAAAWLDATEIEGCSFEIAQG
jgi:hypothetical protein